MFKSKRNYQTIGPQKVLFISSNPPSENKALFLEDLGLLAHPSFHKLCASCSRHMSAANCHVAAGSKWVAVIILRAEIAQN